MMSDIVSIDVLRQDENSVTLKIEFDKEIIRKIILKEVKTLVQKQTSTYIDDTIQDFIGEKVASVANTVIQAAVKKYKHKKGVSHGK